MRRSTERILTTHVGSLIRPAPLLPFIRAKQTGQPYDQQAYSACLSSSVNEIVEKQAKAGIDVPSDGEFGKSISWSQYALERLSGFERRPAQRGGGAAGGFYRGADRSRFAEFYAELDAADGPPATAGASAGEAVCVAPIRYTGQAEVQRDIDNFKSALKRAGVAEGFLPVAAPASVIPDRKNEYYKSDAEMLAAIAEAMRTEYRTIVDAGLLLQLDDARAAVTYDRMVPPASFADYRKWLALQVEAINHATQGIPRDRIRYHVCWGSWPGPHTSDVPLKDIVDLVLQVRAGAYLIEAANPRHEHEWRVWRERKLPEGTVLIPGVITHSNVMVEHPETVADRIVRFAEVAGRENVIAGVDCGFGTFAGSEEIQERIVWAKFDALAQGARLASERLWGRAAG
jgi:5-methyltetrahydropteroyltriglutamate--homocysteine methyltransferase